ncbi:A/G-specific adenine glycosylase [Candidatus Magnetaquicoccus inordinatus]|uniref:A/G-specific adenine glycosylase n=1 Tax=Candidatus Magnetaquicoccus inordinatus TaxID=2496818 RepID=UPI00102B63A1|nr:A/G-specific adenine glycosylase [Candidatus Magnetaquicoccus inordinatus]
MIISDSQRMWFTTQLLSYYKLSGRTLPWRTDSNLYKIWVSEIMLQQTTVKTVIPYYEKFINAFPTVLKLSAASLTEILLLWQGLGYYQRAKNLYLGSRIISEIYQGAMPGTLNEWLKIPGVGLSTASAILAIGTNQYHTILDANVKRVITRFFTISSNNHPSKYNKTLWEVAQKLTSKEEPGDYAQAIMDLGATVCLNRNPECGKCPIHLHCKAYISNSVQNYPEKINRKPKTTYKEVCLLIRNQHNKYLFVRNDKNKLLESLWQPPTFPWPETNKIPTLDSINGLFTLHYPEFRSGKIVTLSKITHDFTHRTNDVYPFCIHTETKKNPTGTWLEIEEWKSIPVSTLYQKVLKAYLSVEQS